MKILSLETPRAIEETITTIQHGGIVAFPTDTVYGLAGSIKFPDTLERMFRLKGRSHDKSLPVLLSSVERLSLVAEIPDARVLALLRELWPGGLTIVLKAVDGLPPGIVAADGTVGVRVPDYSIALMLCERAGGALATTSANRSGQPPSLNAEDIVSQFSDGIDVVLDGGTVPQSVPSTVIRIDDARITTIRSGSIAPEEVEEVWSNIV